MKIKNGEWVYSAHDLVRHLNCTYLTYLEGRVSQGALARPEHCDLKATPSECSLVAEHRNRTVWYRRPLRHRISPPYPTGNRASSP